MVYLILSYHYGIALVQEKEEGNITYDSSIVIVYYNVVYSIYKLCPHIHTMREYREVTLVQTMYAHHKLNVRQY